MKKIMIIMSSISILDFLLAIFFGAWIHVSGNLTADGTDLLKIHMGQGIGTLIFALVTFGLVIIGRGKNKGIIMVIASLLCMIGWALTWFSGWFLFTYNGLIARLARSFNIHEIQAISTAILTIILLAVVIIRETKREKGSKSDSATYPSLAVDLIVNDESLVNLPQ